MNPLYLILPVTISSSFAFMLPVATPPNAIVFAYGHLKIIDMVGYLIKSKANSTIVITYISIDVSLNSLLRSVRSDKFVGFTIRS